MGQILAEKIQNLAFMTYQQTQFPKGHSVAVYDFKFYLFYSYFLKRVNLSKRIHAAKERCQLICGNIVLFR